MLPDLIRRGRSPSVGITVHRGTITLRVTASGESEEKCNVQMVPTILTIHECLGDLVFGEESDELPDVATRLLVGRNETVAVCEWGTGGLIGEWLGSSDPTGESFVGGIVLRSEKQIGPATLGPAFDRGLADFECSRSEQLAVAMAEAIRERFGTTYGVAVSAFPDGSNPADRYSIAVSSPRKTIAKSNPLAAHPDIRRDLAAKQVINLLRLHVSRAET
jgi:nicotinamide-nucleotide amidase